MGPTAADAPSHRDASPTVETRDSAALDRIIGLLASSRVRISMVALEFVDAPPRRAREAAIAASGSTGLLIALTAQRFVVVDVGPRGASPRDDQAIAERVRTLAMTVLSRRGDPSRVRLGSAELHLWSDQVGPAASRLVELERQLSGGERQIVPLREPRRPLRIERRTRVA